MNRGGNQAPEIKLAGVILMGGKSSRMKGPEKAFLSYKGKPFYLCAAECMGEDIPVYLSVDRKADYEGLSYPLIEDCYTDKGPVGGLYSSLSGIEADAVLVLPCDVPRMNKRLIKALKDRFSSCGKTVVLEDRGRLEPLIGIYTRACLPELEAMIRENCLRVSALFERIPYATVIPEESGCTEDALWNINCPEDYQRLKDIMNNGKED